MPKASIVYTVGYPMAIGMLRMIARFRSAEHHPAHCPCFPCCVRRSHQT